MTDYFTSDWHLFHASIAKLRGKDEPWEPDLWAPKFDFTVPATESDREILQALEKLTIKDRLFFLGDLTLGDSGSEESALGTLHYCFPELHLITGNHDSVHPFRTNSLKGLWKWRETFQSISPLRTVKIAGQKALMCHYPYEGDHTKTDRDTQWRPKDSGAIILHGHTHSEEKVSYTADGTLQVHVGWDAWGKFPSKEELTELINKELKKDKYEVRQLAFTFES